MRVETPLLGLVVMALLNPSEGRQQSAPEPRTIVECAVTIPNGIAAGEQQVDATSYGNRQVSVGPFGNRGFQATYVIFPTPGCWEVTGRVADASVTFVTRVVQIGDGPAWRRDAQ